MREVVTAIPAFFQKRATTGAYNFGVAPASALVDLVEELAVSEDLLMQKTAKRVLRLIHGKE
jgi:hypothetical protein